MLPLAALLLFPSLAPGAPNGAGAAPTASPVEWVGCMAGGDEKRPPNGRGDQEAPRRSRKCRPFIILNPPSPELPAPGAPVEEEPAAPSGLFGGQV